MSLRLDQLLDGVAHVPPTMLTGLSLDSRRIKAGDTFVALRGHRSHGLAFAGEALRRGAGSIVFEPPAPADLAVPEGAIAVPDLRSRLGSMADQFFGSPSQSLRVVGVTGTNGKTSTVQLLAQALSGEGRCVGTIGTLGLGLVGAMHAGERTTPDVIAVHSELSAMRAEGAQDVAMEVSSHALDQGRVDAVRFEVAVFTNLTRDHLDYHHSMQAYGEAKARLFSWPGLKAAVINLDDAFGRQLAMNLGESVQLIGVSSREAPSARLQAKAITRDASGLAFDLVDGDRSVTVKSRLLGRFNVDNLLAVAGVLVAMDWSLERIAAQLAQLDPVSGRMNRIGGDATHPLVVVDYAHTPDALEQALRSLRAHTRGQLICVFGCGGERDRGKRPQMAAVAQAQADTVIVTDDNPRGEDGDAIVVDILAGFGASTQPSVERDRARAIVQAIAQAKVGDTVLIAGKGHESYQEIAGIKIPFDDRRVASAALGLPT